MGLLLCLLLCACGSFTPTPNRGRTAVAAVAAPLLRARGACKKRAKLADRGEQCCGTHSAAPEAGISLHRSRAVRGGQGYARCYLQPLLRREAGGFLQHQALPGGGGGVHFPAGGRRRTHAGRSGSAACRRRRRRRHRGALSARKEAGARAGKVPIREIAEMTGLDKSFIQRLKQPGSLTPDRPRLHGPSCCVWIPCARFWTTSIAEIMVRWRSCALASWGISCCRTLQFCTLRLPVPTNSSPNKAHASIMRS